MTITTTPRFVLCSIHFTQKPDWVMVVEGEARKARIRRLEKAGILQLLPAEGRLAPGVANRLYTWDKKRVEKYASAGWTVERVLIDEQRLEEAGLNLSEFGRIVPKRPAPLPARHACFLIDGVYQAHYDFKPNADCRVAATEKIIPFLKGDPGCQARLMARIVRGKVVPLVFHSPSERARALLTLTRFGKLTLATPE